MKTEDAIKKGRKKRPSDRKWEGLLEKNLLSKENQSRNRIFASSAGLCARQTAGLMLLPKDRETIRNAASQFYFKIGSSFENVVSRAFNKAGLLLDEETRVEWTLGETTISGRIDFTIRDPENDEIVLVELKSCGKLPTAPKPVHLAQLYTYMVLTGMPRGIVWYISRSVSDWTGYIKQKPFEVTMTPIERKRIAYKMSIGSVFGTANVLPDIPEDMKKYKCGFCPLVGHCWGGPEHELKLGETISAPERGAMEVYAKSIAKKLIANETFLRTSFTALMEETEF